MAVQSHPIPAVDGLAAALRAVDPRALVVPPRIIRRVIRHHRKLSLFGARVPHGECYTIAREPLLEILDRADLGLDADELVPDVVILIARPDPADEARLAWRRLFHARLHLAFEGLLGEEDASSLARRIEGIGARAFDEARAVLRAEERLLPPADDRSTYIEFASLLLELRRFEPEGVVNSWFPSLIDGEGHDRRLAEEVDAGELLSSTRPSAASTALPKADSAADDEFTPESPPVRVTRDDSAYERLCAHAKSASAAGNTARAAILKARAAQTATPGRIDKARRDAEDEVDRLADRLAAAVGLIGAPSPWRRALAPLLTPAASSHWSRAARLLYDLQNACVDRERPVFRVDLVEWALSFGRRPIKRPLSSLAQVLVLKHLRTAARRVGRIKLAPRDRRRLDAALRTAIEAAEAATRAMFAPVIESTLIATGTSPRDLPERIGFAKLVDELLDRAVERGHLSLPDLRDAFSANSIKLPDLAGPVEFLRGDRLLHADRRLDVTLDGVYRRGEIYLRGLQRASALAFGTRAGRMLTLYVGLPFGGAYVLLEGLQHLIQLVGIHARLASPEALVACGLIGVALLHRRDFRAFVGRIVLALLNACRSVLVDAPAWLLNHSALRSLVDSRTFSILMRRLGVPAALTAASWALMPETIRGLLATRVATGALFVGLGAVLNSRYGRDLEESFTDGVSHGWHRVRSAILPSLYRFIMDVFGALLEAVDQLLYAVDERLRFRGGQGQSSLVGKAILGVGWFYITYLVRFCINLLVEPQINPIKHFPVVTVSHKIIAPMVVRLPKVLTAPPWRMGVVEANSLAATTQFLLPGVFGFLVWELKENWRLYEANRPDSLRPVAVGHHGESMARLLRPGFHSGTLPKAFGRLRRGLREGNRKACRRQREAIHHVEEAVARCAERELVPLLAAIHGACGDRVTVGEVRAGTNGVEIALDRGDCPPARLRFVEREGRLAAEVADTGWIDQLDTKGQAAATDALEGFFAQAGSDRPALAWRGWVDRWRHLNDGEGPGSS